MRDPESVVRDFCAAWSRRDVGELLGYFTADAVYHNIPVEPVTGTDGIRELLNMFAPAASTAEFEILHLASRGNVVFAERVDRFTMNGKPVVVPVTGVFEIRDGKIAAWRDYFDFATWQRQVT
jgi:limonene-1,2-epoxide hydrolase